MVGNRDIEVSSLAPLAGREGKGRAYTRKADYIPLVGGPYTEVDHTMLVEVHIVMRKRTTEKRPESFGNFLRY